MDFKESTGLYLIAGGVIAFVLIQSLFFLVKAWKQGEKLGIDKKKLRDTVTSSAVFTIPSALSVLATVIVLAPSLGLVIPWVRLSVLGNLLYETKAAGDAMASLGQDGGISSTITDPAIFAGVAWVMTLGICFSLVILPFVAKPLHKKMLSLGKKDESEETVEKKSNGIGGFIDIVTPAVFIGLIGAFVARAIAGKGKPETFGDGAGVVSVITLIVAVVASLVLEKIATKFKLSWLEPFVMPIGMVIAMVAAVVVYNVLPPELAILEWRG